MTCLSYNCVCGKPRFTKLLRGRVQVRFVALLCAAASGCFHASSSDREAHVSMVYSYSKLMVVAEHARDEPLPPQGEWYAPKAYPMGRLDAGGPLSDAGARLFLWAYRSVLCIKSPALTECFSRDAEGATEQFGLSVP